MNYLLAIEHDREYIFAYLGAGETLYELRQYTDALYYFDEATKLDPDDCIIWLGKGNILFRAGKFKHAQRAFELALLIDSDLISMDDYYISRIPSIDDSIYTKMNIKKILRHCFCFKCFSINTSYSYFCVKCSNPLNTCPYCLEKKRAAANSCRQCGKLLNVY
jgi:tetratricopeptide (TPR) repeat protein